MKNIMFGVISALLMVSTVHALEPVDRRADELKVYLDLESKDTNVKLDQILHQLYEVNQKVVTLSFIQRYGDEIKMERAMVPNVNNDLVPAWVFKPVNLEQGKSYPAVVAVHGGFHYSLDEEFFGYITRFVREGYVVIFPEYGGSRGYGKPHYDAQQYGSGDVRDTIAAAEWFASQSYVDSKRLGIVGRSRGGMVTLLAIEQKPKLFNAAVDVVGLSDFLMYMAYKPEYRREQIAKEPQFNGLPFDNLQAYIDVSPIMHVEKIETPLLIHATTYDQTVNHIVHQERLVEVLKAHGKKYEYKLYERAPGSHGFSDADTSEAADSLNRIIGFLDKHLK
jgi:dipeptidyl aminopeptidase/acylaminoacyl peptidase